MIPLSSVNLENLSKLNFQKPVLMHGASKDWTAMKKWTPRFFSEKYGKIQVKVREFSSSDMNNHSTVMMTIGEYIDYWNKLGATPPERNLYFANWLYESDCPELNDDYVLPKTLDQDLMDYLPQQLQYPRRWLFFGQPHCHTPAHVDTLSTSAWLAMIMGTKRIRMVAPEYCDNFDRLENLNDLQTLRFCERANIPVIETIITPGHILFIPGGWLHHVTSLDNNILLTGNFLDSGCMDTFLQMIAAKTGLHQQMSTIREDLVRKLGEQI